LRIIDIRSIFCFLLVLYGCPAFAQTVDVDITPGHATNRFAPSEALGAGIDRIATKSIEPLLSAPTVAKVLSAGWQTVSYRQNTELLVEAWHWNPEGTWSDPKGEGYFTGSAAPGKPIHFSYGYGLPHRGFTRNDGTGNAGFSRLTDGDSNTYWKSNPYLTQHFTGEPDSAHPQWVILDLSAAQKVDTIRIAWAAPFATHYLVQYWTADDPIKSPTRGIWQTFPHGDVSDGKGGIATIVLSPEPVSIRYLRIWMTESSNTCDSHGASDPRNCVGFAINELYLGTTSPDGLLHDLIRHTPDQEQTATYCSSVDPWHAPADLTTTRQAQIGFDLFYASGITRGLPAMIPIALIYGTPEDAVAEITYLKKRKDPISYIEMGEEADGQYMLPEDYAALYLQFAEALHRFDPSLKLGGPSFQSVNKDIEVWPDASGQVSWVRRFVNYLSARGRLSDLAFFSSEHYPYDPCKTTWASLYDEPELVTRITQTWRQDGLPPGIPVFITESNLSPGNSEVFMDIFGGLWLADYVGSFLNAGGNALYYFDYLPLPMEHGCNDSPGTIGMFSLDANYAIQQPLSQFFASQLINTEWAQPGPGIHQMFPARADLDDGAGHALITAYALLRPDGQWSLLVVNRDQDNGHKVRIRFRDEAAKKTSAFSGEINVINFGRDQYHWHPARTVFMAHAEHDYDTSVQTEKDGKADPDGPPLFSKITAGDDTAYDLPRASITVLRGKIASK
jgi:F5/8 type C domain